MSDLAASDGIMTLTPTPTRSCHLAQITTPSTSAHSPARYSTFISRSHLVTPSIRKAEITPGLRINKLVDRYPPSARAVPLFGSCSILPRLGGVPGPHLHDRGGFYVL